MMFQNRPIDNPDGRSPAPTGAPRTVPAHRNAPASLTRETPKGVDRG